MESVKSGKVLFLSKRVPGKRMSSVEQARAEAGMPQAVALGNLALRFVDRLRAAMKSLGRGIVTKSNSATGAATQAEMRGW